MNDAIGATQEARREPRGAVEDRGPRAKYLDIKYGCLCEVSKTPVEGWTKHDILDDDGVVKVTKWIKIYESLEMWVDKLEWYSRTHESLEYSGWKMLGHAGDVNYSVDFALTSRATKRLMMVARSIDWDAPLDMRVWPEAGTGNIAINFKQNDTIVPQFYSKADMKECPAPSQKTVMGKTKWDWEETNDFLWREMNEVIAPHIEKSAADRGYVPAVERGPQAPTHSGPAGVREPDMPPMSASDEDIPF